MNNSNTDTLPAWCTAMCSCRESDHSLAMSRDVHDQITVHFTIYPDWSILRRIREAWNMLLGRGIVHETILPKPEQGKIVEFLSH